MLRFPADDAATFADTREHERKVWHTLGAVVRAAHRIAVSIVERLNISGGNSDMGIFFDQERRLIASIEREKDLAATMADPARRQSRLRRVRDLARQLPHTRMERLLLRSL